MPQFGIKIYQLKLILPVISTKELLLQVGTKYTDFNKKKDLKVGVKVFASLFAGKRIGTITSVTASLNPEDYGICLVDGQQTFISDIQYKILS